MRHRRWEDRMIFPQKLAVAATLVEKRLTELLAARGATGTPERLLGAMQHAVLGGGKRFRPFLVIESARLFGLDAGRAVEAAAAVECLHCYSLVHDDLPSMDNDDLRRGQPTVHRAYDEWTAILTGDALSTLAFELLSAPTCHPDASVRSELVLSLARAGGSSGMVGGQALDLEADKLRIPPSPSIDHITHLQALKTGKLIVFGCEAGAILGGASHADRTAVTTYGEKLGVAFQVSDDLLDAEGTVDVVGKATQKDEGAGKATLVSLMGIDNARRYLKNIVEAAVAALDRFGDRAEVLREAAQFMELRKS